MQQKEKIMKRKQEGKKVYISNLKMKIWIKEINKLGCLFLIKIMCLKIMIRNNMKILQNILIEKDPLKLQIMETFSLLLQKQPNLKIRSKIISIRNFYEN